MKAQLPASDCWHCRIIRAGIARGRISAVLVNSEFDSTAALLIQQKDLPNSLNILGESLPLLSGETVQYRGQPIALLLAESRQMLDVSEAMIHVRYEELPSLPVEYEAEEQVFHEVEKVYGDPKQGWKRSTQTIEGSYHIGTQADFNRDNLKSVAQWRGRSRKELNITAPLIWPHLIARNLDTVIPQKELNIISENPGSFYDYLLVDGSLIALYAAFAACLSGKSVSLEYSREEQLLFGSRQPIIHVRYRSGLDKDNAVCVNDVQVDVNVGAFNLFTTEMVQQILSAAIGFYTIPHWSLNIRLYHSSLPPMNIFHGFPSSLLQIPVEVQANCIAQMSGENPLTWRRNNLLQKGDNIPPERIAQEDLDSRNALSTVNELSDYMRKYSAYELLRKQRFSANSEEQCVPDRYQGIGLAYGFQPSGFSRSMEKKIKPTVRVELHGDGMVHAYVNVFTSTARHYLEQIIKEELDIDGDKVVFHSSDFREIPDSGPVCLSRLLTVVSDTFRKACVRLQKQRFQKPLPLSVEASLRIAQNWNEKTLIGDPFMYRSYGAAVLELELDMVTYLPDITRIWMVVDAPSFFDIRQARSALEGGIMNCLDWVRSSPVHFVNGIMDIGSDFFPVRRENRSIPQIEIEFLRGEGDKKTRDIRNGFRDMPFALIPPAYLSALNQASMMNLSTIPADGQTIFTQLKKGGLDHED